MGKDFNGTSSKISGTVTAIDTGDWTMGAWVYPLSLGEANTGAIGWVGTATPTDAQVLRVGGTTKFDVYQGYSPTLSRSISANGAWTASTWCLVFGTFRASDVKCRIFTGSQSAAVVEQTYTSQTAGTSARTTGATVGYIGNNSAAATTWDGRIVGAFLVPYELTLAEMEEYRTGNLAAIFHPGVSPRFLCPMDSPNSVTEDLSGNNVAFTETNMGVYLEGPPVLLGFPGAVTKSQRAGAGVPRAMAANVDTAASAKATMLTRSRLVAAKAATSTSAKATILRSAKGVAAKAGTATSAKATMLTRARPLAAKAGTASSAKATNLVELKRLAAKASTSSSAKAGLVEAKRLTAKSGAASGAKASTLARARPAAAHLGTASSAKATTRTARPLLTKAATAASAKASLTTQHAGQKAMEAKVNTATSAKAVMGKTLPLAAKAPTATSAKALRLNRLRTTFAAATIPTATNAKATTLGFAKGLSVKLAIATSARGDFNTGHHKHVAGKAPIAVSAKASLRVGFLASGFNVLRSVGGRTATSSEAFGFLTAQDEAFNVLRRMRAKTANATSAKAGLTVSYYGNGGFLVSRPIAAKAATSTYARADMDRLVEAFRVFRPIGVKAAVASSAKASLVMGVTGPGFVVARAMRGKAATASSAKASLGVAHQAQFAKFPIAVSAKATALRRGAGMTVKAAIVSSARATPPLVARPLSAKAATATTCKPAFLDTQHAGQKSLGAKANTASSAKAQMVVARPLGGKAATVSSAHAERDHTFGYRTFAPIATSAWGTMGYGRPLAGKVPIACSARATVGGTDHMRAKAPITVSAKADLFVKTSSTLGGVEIDFHPEEAGVELGVGSPSRRRGAAVTFR